MQTLRCLPVHVATQLQIAHYIILSLPQLFLTDLYIAHALCKARGYKLHVNKVRKIPFILEVICHVVVLFMLQNVLINKCVLAPRL